jgi:pimeloyl-ACP methyl ester carboxylesterase
MRTVENAGHFPMVERPAVFADLLDEYLRTSIPVEQTS